jgi:hypothetical protein
VADWLFVIGLSIEISGAALVAGEVLFASGEEIAARKMTFPSSGTPFVEAQRGPALTWIGVAVLALGFALQLVGYVVSSDDYWFFALAPVVIVATFFGGRALAAPVARLQHRRALAYLRGRGMLDE